MAISSLIAKFLISNLALFNATQKDQERNHGGVSGMKYKVHVIGSPSEWRAQHHTRSGGSGGG